MLFFNPWPEQSGQGFFVNMMIISRLIKKLKQSSKRKRIIFPEGRNHLIQLVAKRLSEQQLATCFLVFATRKEVPKDLHAEIQCLIIDEFAVDELVEKFYQLRKGKVDAQQSRLLMQKSNYFAMMLLKLGRVDCFLGGIEYATADILRPAFQIIKLKPGSIAATSAFLMIKDDQSFLFADCALTIDPTANDLVNIAKNTQSLADVLEFEEKKIAMLSFSTAGSGGKNALVEKVQTASKQLLIDLKGVATVVGEIQFDAAFSQSVRKKKWPQDRLNFNGSANIFIFPDLNAGNIGYKIAQRFAGCEAVGPIIIGLNAPVNDLSRGASQEDIYQTAIVTLSQVES